MLAYIYHRAQAGVDAPAVTIEVYQSNGLPTRNIVGLPEAAVRESKDRVCSALISSRFDSPARKLTVNLAGSTVAKITHVAEAVSHRVLDRHSGSV